MTKLAPEWVRTSDPVIRSPARYRWTTAPSAKFTMGNNDCIHDKRSMVQIKNNDNQCACHELLLCTMTPNMNKYGGHTLSIKIFCKNYGYVWRVPSTITALSSDYNSYCHSNSSYATSLRPIRAYIYTVQTFTKWFNCYASQCDITSFISEELDTVNNYLHNCRFLNECFESTTHFNHIFCTARL